MTKPILDGLQQQLQQAFVDNVDPVAFAYTQSLIKRLANVEFDSNSDAAMGKAIDNARAYLSKVESLRKHAESSLEKIPQSDELNRAEAETLFKEHRFRKLERLVKRLEARNRALPSSSLLDLQSLTASMDLAIGEQNQELEESNQATIEQLLAKQEQHAKVATGELDPDLQNGPIEQLELRSMKYFRESMKYYNVDKTISRAISEEPQNPGPLNPHMIAVRGLATMHDLSPHYTRRFAAYLETLLWLEKNMNKLNGASAKKA